LLQPSSGRILVDNQLLDDRKIAAWQRTLGYVPQAIYLADDTVLANIAFGVPKGQIDQQAIERAAHTAHIKEFITHELPHGYNTVIGERGIRLSGGQRQRLAIARALYHDPDVVVFDEATSALDNVTEKIVMEAIKELLGRKTVILIAHRLTTVRSCDKVYLFDHGHIVDQGKYEDLMKSSTAFKQMVSAAGPLS